MSITSKKYPLSLIRLCFISFFLLLSACSKNSEDPLQRYKNQSSATLFTKGEHQLAKANYQEGTQYLEALDSLYPFSPESRQARLDLIYAYYKAGDYASALAAADRYIHLYPRGKDVDYAFYMKGVIDLERGPGWLLRALKADPSDRDLDHLQAAFVDFTQLANRFPYSRYTPMAILSLHYIRNHLAESELNVAEFYFVRHAYVAAANRAANVVEHYQGSPQVADALVMMVKSYKALNLPKLAEQSMQVLQLNYPSYAAKALQNTDKNN